MEGCAIKLKYYTVSNVIELSKKINDLNHLTN